MNTILKVGVASTLALGGAAAHASIALPSSGSSDLILFAEVVTGSNTEVASYAGDTGIAVPAVGGSLSSTTVLGSDANLAALFAADAAGDTLEWAVQGGAFTGGTTTGNFGTAGAVNFITTNGGPASNLTGKNVGNLVHWSSLDNTVSGLNTNFAGANSVEGNSAATAGIWDATQAGTNVYGWYGNGPTTNITLGSSATLFGVTGNGSSISKVVTSSLGTALLTSSGLQITGNSTPPPPVPLPPAVWLLGSGLLGLAGIARRKRNSI